MKLNDTIVAQSTPQGEGAIGIIRLSGKDSIKITNKLFPSKDLSNVKSHTIHYGNLEYKNSIIFALHQLGLNYDDEITYQSNRFDHYIDKI